MPFEQVIPPAFPKWEVDQTWPPSDFDIAAIGSAIGATGELPNTRRAFPSSAITQDFVVRVSGVNIAPNWAVHNGLLCISPQPGASPSTLFYSTNVNIPGPMNNEGFNAAENFLCNVPVPSWKRVFIDEFLIAFSTATIPALSTDTMLWGAVPDQSANQTALYGNSGVHYGLRVDGSGGIEFYSTIGGVLQENVAVTWPEADFREWVKVIVEHQTANISGAGQLRIWFTDSTNLVISRNWGAGTTLPDLADAATGRTFRRYFGQNSGEGADTMFVTGFRSRAGRYTFDGTELT